MKRMSRAGRKGEIMKLFVDRHVNQKDTELTVYEVAELMGLERSTYLQKLLMELVENGQLTVIQKPHRPGVMKRVFDLSENWKQSDESELAQAFGSRMIRVNSKRSVTQSALLWVS